MTNKKLDLYYQAMNKKSFYGVKLRGNETFDDLLKIEQDFNERVKRDQANIQRVDAQIKKKNEKFYKTIKFK